MAGEPVIHSVLANDAGVAALVGARISPMRADLNETLPFVVYAREATDPWQATDGFTGMTVGSYSFECYAATEAEVVALHKAVRLAFDNLSTTTVGGETVEQATWIGGSNDVVERGAGSAEPVYLATLDFDVFIREAVS